MQGKGWESRYQGRGCLSFLLVVDLVVKKNIFFEFARRRMDSFFFGVMPKSSVHIFSLTRLAKNCLLAAAATKK